MKISNKRFLITIAMGLAAALVLTAAVGEMKLKNAKKSIIQTSDKTSKTRGKKKIALYPLQRIQKMRGET